ncbi:UNVERIFIED_CONTAM: hypothetical protein PYX00_010748 [Menopon gallinae]|uniref:Uncharacterized protein n=1 Tax=Menopon gallinae TaxID=328185 RepID=A0AAW2HGH7_9NEOP
MWTSLSGSPEEPAPCSRTKHSATLLGSHVYLFGGRNGNLPLKDLWKYHLVEGKWEKLEPAGDKPPCLQEHSAVAYKESIYIFGGEVGFSAGTETPLWIYSIKNNSWRKVQGQKGVTVPRGRRGHTALVYKGSMLIYGGYQDLRGSSNELWAFHFETESWHLLSPTCSSGAALRPSGRHKHSAVLHDDAMWIYGGMTDLQERNDFWRWDTMSKVWTNIKTKTNPGFLHSHAACKLPSSMLIFGGETNGQPSSEIWRFHFGTELWEKLQFTGTKPQPRAEGVALSVSELVLQDKPDGNNSSTTTAASLANSQRNPRVRGGGSVDRSKSIPNNKIGPVEKKYVFNECNKDYISGNLVSTNNNNNNNLNFLKEITKLSSINLSRLNPNKSSYTVLDNNHDSTESLLRTKESSDSENTPTRMVKSQSANVISGNERNKSYSTATTPAGDKMPYSIVESGEFSVTDSDKSSRPLMSRDPASVPNFTEFVSTLPEPVLTPVECTRLVYLDSEEENELQLNKSKPADNVNNDNSKNGSKINKNEVTVPGTVEEELEPEAKSNGKFGFSKSYQSDSYTSHLVTLGNEDHSNWKNGIPKSASVVRFKKQLEEITDELTSDYCSIETVNRISSSSNYSQSPNELRTELINDYPEAKFGKSTSSSIKKYGNRDLGYGFSNPNYLGSEKTGNKPKDARSFAKILSSPPDSVLEDAAGRSMSRNFNVENVEMRNMTGNRLKQVEFKISKQMRSPPRYLPLRGSPYNTTVAPIDKRKRSRASSASRAERHLNFANRVHESLDEEFANANVGPGVPLYVFLIGGKENGQLTVFKKPISVWKLQLSSSVY